MPDHLVDFQPRTLSSPDEAATVRGWAAGSCGLQITGPLLGESRLTLVRPALQTGSFLLTVTSAGTCLFCQEEQVRGRTAQLTAQLSLGFEFSLSSFLCVLQASQLQRAGPFQFLKLPVVSHCLPPRQPHSGRISPYFIFSDSSLLNSPRSHRALTVGFHVLLRKTSQRQ